MAKSVILIIIRAVLLLLLESCGHRPWPNWVDANARENSAADGVQLSTKKGNKGVRS